MCRQRGAVLILLGVILWAGPAVAQQLFVSPNSLNFGKKVRLEPEPFIMAVTIENRSPDPLQFTGGGIEITGQPPNNVSFALSDNPSTAPLGYFERRTVSVSFAPATVGHKQAALRIYTNDPVNPGAFIPLFGEGIPPRLTPAFGPYDGVGPGQSTIGTGGHYLSLFDACLATSTTSLTGGDWTFLILNDLVETKNVTLTCPDSGGNRIYFRPAPGTSSTITFAPPTVDFRHLPGHFIIGARHSGNDDPRSWAYTPTHNITIDGSNDPATNTRNLTLRNTSIHSSRTSLIHVAGDCDRFQLKNCTIDHTGVFFDSVYGYQGAIEFMPQQIELQQFQYRYTGCADNCSVTNCYITEGGTDAGAGIMINVRPGSISNYPVLTPPTGITFADNTIRAPVGITLKSVKQALVAGNAISIKPGRHIEPPGILCNAERVGAPTDVTIDANTIIFPGDPPDLSYPNGIAISAIYTTGTFQLTNNIITGLTGPAPHQFVPRRYGVLYGSDSLTTALIAHNSINIHNHPDAVTTTTACAAIAFVSQFPFSAGQAVVRNNIFRVDMSNATVYRHPTSLSNLQSNNNIFYLGPNVSMAHTTEEGGRTYTTFADWQTSTGQDLASSIADPFTATGPDFGTWIGPADSYSPDLRFNGHPGPAYQQPFLPEIAYDIDGQPRPPVATTAGADEVLIGSAVENWMIY